MGIKIGIAGQRGLVYMPGLIDLKDVKVTAFCDLNECVLEKRADEFGIENRFRVFEDMGATISRGELLFMAFTEMIIPGLVLPISVHTVGSRLTIYMSP